MMGSHGCRIGNTSVGALTCLKGFIGPRLMIPWSREKVFSLFYSLVDLRMYISYVNLSLLKDINAKEVSLRLLFLDPNSCHSYSEAISFLYSENTFCVRQSRVLVDFSLNILPQRLQSIRSLHMDVTFEYPWTMKKSTIGIWPSDDIVDWRDACVVLSRIHRLRHLRVTLTEKVFANFPSNFARNPLGIVPYLELLIAVKASATFLVELGWSVKVEDVLKKMGEVPFTLVSLP